MKIWILEKNRNKKTEKCSKNWKKNKRVKKDINRTFFYNEASKKKRKAKKKRKEKKRERDGLM